MRDVRSKAPLAIVPRSPRAGRAHVSFPKPGCFCSRCERLRERGQDLRGVIAIYEARLSALRRTLWEIEA